MFSVHDPLMGAFLSAQVQQETIPGRCAWVCTWSMVFWRRVELIKIQAGSCHFLTHTSMSGSFPCCSWQTFRFILPVGIPA